MKLKTLFVVLSLSLSVFLIFRIKRELIIHRSLSYSLQQVNNFTYYEFDYLKGEITSLKKKDKYLDAKYEYIYHIWIDTLMHSYKQSNLIDSIIDLRYKLFSSLRRLQSNSKINLFRDSLQNIYNDILTKVEIENYMPLCFIRSNIEKDSVKINLNFVDKSLIVDNFMKVVNQNGDTISHYDCITKKDKLKALLINPVTGERQIYEELNLLDYLKTN